MFETHDQPIEFKSIIALEGGVCAGKTSVAAELLSKRIASNVISEFMSFIPEPEHIRIAGLPLETKLRIFLDIQQLRIAEVKAPAGLTVQDRSVFTLVAHDWAQRELGMIPSLHHLEPLWKEASLSLPNGIVFMDVDHSIRQKRFSERGHEIPPYFLMEDFNRALRIFFIRLADFLPALFLDSACQSPGELAGGIGKWAQTLGRHRYSKKELLASIREAIE